MLRAGIALVMLAAWTAALPAARSTADDQSPKVTIKGSLSYETSESLPSDSRAVVELRHVPALPTAPAVAERRIDLAGKSSPVSFDFAVERFRIVGGVTYILRVTILSGTRAILTSEDVKIDVTPSEVDAGEIKLKPAK